MDKRLIDEDWKYLCQFLPEDLSELAKATGTVKRWRNVKNGEELLRLILAPMRGWGGLLVIGHLAIPFAERGKSSPCAGAIKTLFSFSLGGCLKSGENAIMGTNNQ